MSEGTETHNPLSDEPNKHFPPVGEQRGKKEQVEAMFDSIAPRYDLLNRVLSAGIDQRWRARLVEKLREEQPRRILDVATGTADVAIAAAKLNPEKIVGVDISEQMLAFGRQKVAEAGLSDLVTLQRGDSARLPFSDRQFDAVTVAFGVRNFEDLDRGLAQMHRVLRDGGVALILEFSQPHAFPIKQLYGFYSRYVLPTIGTLVSRDRGAYHYLPESVAAFPSGEAMLERLRTAGFTDVAFEPLTFGISSIYTARRGQ